MNAPEPREIIISQTKDIEIICGRIYALLCIDTDIAKGQYVRVDITEALAFITGHEELKKFKKKKVKKIRS